MKFSLLLATCITIASPALAALDQPWQKLTHPTAAEAATLFARPPPEYSAQFTWGWGSGVTREVIAKDLEAMQALNVHAAVIEPKFGLEAPYLSDGWFEKVKIGVEEAKKRNMRLWFIDEGGYPSGFAGGKFTEERPELRMQGLVNAEHIAVRNGETFSRTLSDDVICVVAINKINGAITIIESSDNRINWQVPASGEWEIAMTNRVYRTMPTRSSSNPQNIKDRLHSLMDYLDPVATKQFVEWTFDPYARAIGDELGKTVLGFRGDEPAYGLNPWTPNLFEEFQKRKGYDLRRYVHAFGAMPVLKTSDVSTEVRKAYADYCDVWSDLFREHFFKAEADWCAKHNLEFQVHVEHEDILQNLAYADGDIFKCLRDAQVPGVDIIWHQLWMDNPAEFPKLASSVAHVYGHPRALCEAFAAYRPPPNLKEARWLLDFLLTRGINRIEYMFWPAGRIDLQKPATGPAAASFQYFRDPEFPKVAAYVNRLSYLLGEGRPEAQIGVYLPSSSFWLATPEQAAALNTQVNALAHQLMEHQRDFDFVDEHALGTALTLEGDHFVNLSKQHYRAIIIPPSLVISRKALDRLETFAKAGGRVIFIGPPPAAVVDRAFLNADQPAKIDWATLQEKEVSITPAVLAKLPAPDFVLEKPNPSVGYTHRNLADAELYFIFNSGDEKLTTNAILKGDGEVQVWNAETGTISPYPGAVSSKGEVRLPLNLEPWSTVLIVIRRLPPL